MTAWISSRRCYAVTVDFEKRGVKFVVIVFFVVSFAACIAGAICGIGGGVIIKPVLDALNVMNVSSVSCLSGCTVLAMSAVSVCGNLRAGRKLEVRITTLLAVGAVAGGFAGSMLFQMLREYLGRDNFVGMVQAAVLVCVTSATLIYTLFKNKIRTRHFTNSILCIVVGLLLGMVSSFLGIGGGPVNLVVLGFLFSLNSKDAAFASLYIIMFSQAANLIRMIVCGTMPEFQLIYLIVMVAGGILGGALGTAVNRKIRNEQVDKLFIALMAVIICINIYNVFQFAAV